MIVRARGVIKSYHGADAAPTTVLRGVDLTVDAGVVISIMGPSGAGKSTLLHLLGSLDTPDEGSIEICVDGLMVDLAKLSASALARVRCTSIGIVHQFHHLLPEFTAIENVMMPARIAGVGDSEARERAYRMLEKVAMEHRCDHLPAELSGGEQQRVAVARALMNGPMLVLADEPTGNLDSANAHQVSNLLIDLVRQQGAACVLATHSAELAARADVRLVMSDGMLAIC